VLVHVHEEEGAGEPEGAYVVGVGDEVVEAAVQRVVREPGISSWRSGTRAPVASADVAGASSSARALRSLGQGGTFRIALPSADARR
jgi:hypothetical protein